MKGDGANRLINIEILGNGPIKQKGYVRREDFFYIYRTREETSNHTESEETQNEKGDVIYLVAPFRSRPPEIEEKEGYVIGFSREVLYFEVQEFSLDVYQLFNRQNEYTMLLPDPVFAEELDAVAQILKKETDKEEIHLLLARTILKAFLLKLIVYKESQFTPTDINEKRIYDFFVLLEQHYLKERNVAFYADKLNISPKRLNQILKKRLNKTINQLIQNRLIMEAKHLLFLDKTNIKEIAFELGFEDKSYFSRFFRKVTGVTPEKFKKQVKDLLFKP